jgi:hypothetical protein
MNPPTAYHGIDNFAEDLIEMAANNSTQLEMLTWLSERGVTVSRSTLTCRFTEWRDRDRERPIVSGVQGPDLEQAINYFFHHHPTYSDPQIAQRIQEEYGLQTTANQVKVIRHEQGWLRRNNDIEVAEDEEEHTTTLIQQLLEEGRIRQYGRRQLITHLARKYGHRSRENDVRKALQILDNYGIQSRRPQKKKKRLENYEVPGPDWLWCLDGHDKLAKYGIEIYACVDAYSRKIIWFYVGSSNRTQVSVVRQYLTAVKAMGYCPSFLRTDKGRETPMMADAQYYFYHTACFEDTTIPDEIFDQICFADCYIYGTSIHNVKIESLWHRMRQGSTDQWILFFRVLTSAGWYRFI